MTSKYAFSDGTMPPIIFDLEALIDFRFYALTLANEAKVTDFVRNIKTTP